MAFVSSSKNDCESHQSGCRCFLRHLAEHETRLVEARYISSRSGSYWFAGFRQMTALFVQVSPLLCSICGISVTHTLYQAVAHVLNKHLKERHCAFGCRREASIDNGVVVG